MSFRCSRCKKAFPLSVSADDRKPVRVVLATETVSYPRRRKPNSDEFIDNGGIGARIVAEADCCTECAQKTPVVHLDNKTFG